MFAPHNTRISFLESICHELGLKLNIQDDDSYRIFTDAATGLSVNFNLKDNKLSFFFQVRPLDIVHHGDRSDVHVIVSLLFASFLRKVADGISCELFDIPHPVCDNEIYGRYIMPVQTPGFLNINTEAELQERIVFLLSVMDIFRLQFWENAGCPCEECVKALGIDNYRDYQLPKEMEIAIQAAFKKPKNSNYGNRRLPDWHYIYDIDHELTIIKSKGVAKFLQSFIDYQPHDCNQVKGLSGTMVLDGEVSNYISDRASASFQKVAQQLCPSKKKVQLRLIPLENMIVTVVDQYVLALGRHAGIYEFKKQKERLRARHN